MIRKALGSYGEALYLAVFLSFADKSQVTCRVLNFPIITAMALSDTFRCISTWSLNISRHNLKSICCVVSVAGCQLGLQYYL